ncbi:HK97 gp10 family phage protein [Thermosyntropha sp.]|uniref:HK97 gp10 family phage protein n=1 Tax=Thermosyntropha sp. TaxID=2740820 RepID=UPI0025DC073C|nr:HK97 gp10 family phage protein [Thermosyntropha sp.]MBO8158831.1 HK97 gp10 family phage protein [Thermosyntropha sp.]
MPNILDITELDKWEKWVLAIIEDSPTHYRKLVRQAGNLVKKKARQITPKVSGDLRKSYRVRVKKSPSNEYIVEVGTNLFYAKMVEEGHAIVKYRRHKIPGKVRPRREKIELGFVPGKFYFRRACEEAEKEFPALLKQSIRQMAKEMGLDVWG